MAFVIKVAIFVCLFGISLQLPLIPDISPECQQKFDNERYEKCSRIGEDKLKQTNNKQEQCCILKGAIDCTLRNLSESCRKELEPFFYKALSSFEKNCDTQNCAPFPYF